MWYISNTKDKTCFIFPLTQDTYRWSDKIVILIVVFVFVIVFAFLAAATERGLLSHETTTQRHALPTDCARGTVVNAVPQIMRRHEKRCTCFQRWHSCRMEFISSLRDCCSREGVLSYKYQQKKTPRSSHASFSPWGMHCETSSLCNFG